MVANFAEKTNLQLAEELGITPYQVSRKAYLLNLKKSARHLAVVRRKARAVAQ